MKYCIYILSVLFVSCAIIMAASVSKKNPKRAAKQAKLKKVEQLIGMDLDVYLSDAEIDKIQNVPDLKERAKNDAIIMRFFLGEWRKSLQN